MLPKDVLPNGMLCCRILLCLRINMVVVIYLVGLFSLTGIFRSLIHSDIYLDI